MKQFLKILTFAVLVLASVHGLVAFAELPPNLSNPATRQTYIKSCTERIEKTPGDYQPYLARAYIYVQDDKLQESLADLAKANELKPNDFGVIG